MKIKLLINFGNEKVDFKRSFIKSVFICENPWQINVYHILTHNNIEHNNIICHQ